MIANIQTYLKKTYGYTDFQIAQIQYTLLSVLSELSKLLVIGIFFYYTGHLASFVFAAIVLYPLRTATGGFHFNHYWSCLLMSFLFFFIGIYAPACLQIPKSAHLLLLILCIMLNHKCSPVVSCYHPVPDKNMIKRAKHCSFSFISIFATLMLLIPANPYLPVGTWIIVLHSLQLAAAKLLPVRRNSI